jgi:gliding motility-associated protein GldL
MSNKKGGFSDLLYSTIMPKIYGIGASVVIIGAMFKILHLTGADIMLMVGLTTEAVIFLLSAFEPKHNEVDWSLVYPELAGDTSQAPRRRELSNGKDSVSKKLDTMLESSKIGPELIDSLGKGMKNLSESVTQMGSLANAAVATNEYAGHVKEASKSLVNLNQSYSATVNAMSEMSAASKDAKQYHEQVQLITKNLSSLNSVYELELQDANGHLKALNKFYSNLGEAIENVTEASKSTEEFKNQFSSLNQNISSLNRVYGNMLSAMKA